MALTPEDVVNKRFQPTKFREGYDQDEVDDFLDEVVVELRRLNQENEELRQRLGSGDGAPSETPAPVSAFAAPQNDQVAEPAEETAVEDEPQPEPEPTPVVESAPEPAPATSAIPSYSDPGAIETESTNNLLILARRLHEEHVREGVEKRDALIADGHATAARLVAEAEAGHRQQIEELEQQKAGLENEKTELENEKTELEQRAAQLKQEQGQIEQQTKQLEDQRGQAERQVEELRTFEREYRDKLKGYIEGQLRELDNASPVSASSDDEKPSQVAAQQAGFSGFGGN